MKMKQGWKMSRVAAAVGFALALEAGADKARFSDLPAKAQRTINANLSGGVVQEIDRKARDGRTVYEVEIRHEGLNRHLLVDADGTLLRSGNFGGTRLNVDLESAKNDDLAPGAPKRGSETLGLSEVPAAVRETIQREVEGWKVVKIEMATLDGRPVYEVDIERDGPNRQLRLAANGELLKDSDGNPAGAPARREVGGTHRERKSHLELNRLPFAVQRTIARQVGASEEIQIDRRQRDGQTYFEVKLKREGADRRLEIDRDGKIMKDELE